jgi:glutamate/tyrosine decarboxylase-like PLP-dependent enzyme
VLYASQEAHHSLEKSAGLLGLGRTAVRRIPLDDDLRLDPAALVRQIEATVAAEHNLWLHVDGAYGAAAAFSDRYRPLLAGIERADSITIDPHKWLSMPFAAGVILTRHPTMLERTFAVTSPYMPQMARPSLLDNYKVSAQWSRRMNSLKLWLTLRVHGRVAYEELIDRQMHLAAQMRQWIDQSEFFEMAAPQTLPILAFRLRGVDKAGCEAAHREFVEEFNRDGRYWISPTKVQGLSVLRMGIISYLSTAEHLHGVQQALTAAAERCCCKRL